MDILKQVSNIGIVPVIAIDDASKAVPLAKALAAGGLPAAEVTFRTAAAEDAIRAIVQEVPEMLVGAGTVITTEQADRAMAAGATFIVAPGYDPKVTQHVLDKGGIMMPGTASAGEMQQAMNQGCQVIKYFPAEANGGVAMLKNIGAALKGAKWMYRRRQRQERQRLSGLQPDRGGGRHLDVQKRADRGREVGRDHRHV